MRNPSAFRCNRETDLDQGVLDVPDFSATTDLYQIVSNVYRRSIFPVELKNIIILIAMTLLPLVPATLVTVPLHVILEDLAKLLF